MSRRDATRTAWLAPSMRGYQRGWLRFDLLAGLAAGTVVIPQAMAYATIAGLPVQVGLYTCIVPMAVYALLGGARAASVSTTSTIAVLVAATLAGLGPQSPEDLLRSATTLTFVVGLCLLLMRLFRLGSLVENISPATLAGIKVGVGLTVAAGQLPTLLGVGPAPEGSGLFASLVSSLSQLSRANPATVLVSVVAIAALLVLRRVLPSVPGPLLVVAAGIILVATTDLEDRGLAVTGAVPTGLPSPVLPQFGEIFPLLPGAAAIAVMAFLETVLVARTNRRSDEPRIDSDQELLATGAAALAGGFTSALPPAGGFSQSVVNLRAGARTQVAQLVTVVLAVLVALFLAPVLADLPKAVLAAMVMVAVVGLLDPAELARFARIDRAELWVAVVVGLLGLTGGMLLGVAVGVALTLLLVVRYLNQSRVRPLYPRVGGGWTINRETATEAVLPGDAVVLHLDQAVYTGNAQVTQDAVLAASRPDDRPVALVVLEGSAVRGVTVPLVDMLRALSEGLAAQGTVFVLAGWPEPILDRLRRSRWFASAEPGLVRQTVDVAVGSEPVTGARPLPEPVTGARPLPEPVELPLPEPVELPLPEPVEGPSTSSGRGGSTGSGVDRVSGAERRTDPRT